VSSWLLHRRRTRLHEIDIFIQLLFIRIAKKR